jgi:hypothetical protein
MKPKVEVITNNPNGSKVYIVDPNPDGEGSFEPTDRFIFVSLEAFMKPRSVSIKDVDGAFFSSRGGKKISFIPTTKQEGRDYATYSYTDMGGEGYAHEGFGISSIDISLRADFVPKVRIKFHDALGITMKEMEEGRAIEDNPLSSFFTYPYPIFKLTVKGFYGTPVSYCLHLLKVNFDFDPSSGGYGIDAEFVGYTFSFLSDLPMRMVMGLASGQEGAKYLGDALPLKETVSKLGNVTRYISEYQEDVISSETAAIEEAIEELNKLYAKIGRKADKTSNSIKSAVPSINSISRNNFSFTMDVGVFKSAASDGYSVFYGQVEELIKKIEIAYNQYSVKNISSISLPGERWKGQRLVGEMRNLLSSRYPNFGMDVISEADLLEGIDGSSPPFVDDYFIVDFHELRSEVEIILKNAEDELKTKRAEMLVNLNRQIKEKFDISIGRFFSDLCANIDACLSLINEYSVLASSPLLRGRRLQAVSSAETDLPPESEVYPFPDVNIGGEKSWVGKLPGADKEIFPEIALVNIVAENMFYNVRAINEEIREVEGTASLPSASDGFPFGAIGSASDYRRASNINEILYAFFKRLHSAKAIYGLKDGEIWMLMEIEGVTASNFITDSLLKESFLAYKENADAIIAELMQNGDILESPSGFLLPSDEIVGGINLGGLPQFFFESKNKDLFDSIEKRQSVDSRISSFARKKGFWEALENDGFYMKPNGIRHKDDSLAFMLRNIRWWLKDVDDIKSIANLRAYENRPYSPQYQKFSEPFYKTWMNVIDGDDIFQTFSDENGTFSIADFSNDFKRLMLSINLGYDELPIKKMGEIFERPSHVSIQATGFLLYLGSLLTIGKKAEDGLLTPREALFFDTRLTRHRDVFLRVQSDFGALFFQPFVDYASQWGEWGELERVLKVFSDTAKRHGETLVGSSDPLYAPFRESHDWFLSLVKKTEKMAVIAPPLRQEKFIARRDFANFYKTFKNSFDSLPLQKKKEDLEEKKYLEDDDLLIEIYNSLKIIYDRWIALGETDGKVYNICSPSGGNLFSNMYIVDRAWNEIGDKAVINPTTVFSMLKNPVMNVYQFIAETFNKNNFNCYFAPSFIGFNNEAQMEAMFSPNTSLSNISNAPAIIAMYVGEPSRHLRRDANFKGDGFDMKRPPQDFFERAIGTGKQLPSAYNVSSFVVNFGQNNQEHFSSVNVNTQEFQNTAEYLITQSEILDKGGGAKRFFKGLDVYNLYKARSFTCSVEGMGNMNISPMQYFQLNIPLFDGAYIITEVSHSLTPHNHTTNFKGQRVSRFSMPIVTDATSYVLLGEDRFRGTKKVAGRATVNENTYGADEQTAAAPASASSNVLYPIIGRRGLVEYRLEEGLSYQMFLQRAESFFKPNGSQMDTFGLKSGYCMAWVKNALARLGVISVPFGGVDAWDFFAGLYPHKIKFFPKNFSSPQTRAAHEYQRYLTNGVNIVFGYFETSRFKKLSVDTILQKNNPSIVESLRELNRSNYEINPITHIGLTYKGVLYDLVNGVRVNPVTSFVPIAYTDVDKDVRFLLTA